MFHRGFWVLFRQGYRVFVALNPLNTGVFSKYGVQKKNPTLPDTIVSELEWDYGAGNRTWTLGTRFWSDRVKILLCVIWFFVVLFALKPQI